MEQNIQPPPIPSPPVNPPNYHKFNFSTRILSILIIFLIVGIGSYLYSQYNHPNITNPSISTTPSSSPPQATISPELDVGQKIYFGKGQLGNYTLFDIQSGETKPFIPTGYTIIDQHNYHPFPSFLFLQKGNDLFSYNIKNNLPNSIFGSAKDLFLKDNETVFVYPSITEKDKFILTINELGPEREGMGPPILNTRTYTFDASSNKLTSINNLNSLGCLEYDSKNKRLFSWVCGEGTGVSPPLSILNLDGTKQKDILTLDEFGLNQEDTGPISLHYQDGYFFAHDKNDLTKIIILDPRPVVPTKETFQVSDTVHSNLKEVYPYSNSISKDNNTLIVGSGNSILLLRYDANNLITQNSYIPENEVYSNFIFLNNGKLIYQSKDNIRIVNLKTWQVEKSIPSGPGAEITLFSD